jgi:hypothetical protein
VLYPWQFEWAQNPFGKEDVNEGWPNFEIPFVLQVRDDLLHTPRKAPDLSEFESYDLASYPHLTLQEERGEGPDPWITLDEAETHAFERFVRHVHDLLRKVRPWRGSWAIVRPDAWQFLDIALANLMRAFSASGVDQLFWHVIALEALLRGKGDGGTNRLAQRVAWILAETADERTRSCSKSGKSTTFDPSSSTVANSRSPSIGGTCAWRWSWPGKRLSGVSITWSISSRPAPPAAETESSGSWTSPGRVNFVCRGLPRGSPMCQTGGNGWRSACDCGRQPSGPLAAPTQS